jgi:hypothetical protein
VVKSRGAWRGGYTEFAGFMAVHHKTIGVPLLLHKAKTKGLVGGDGILVHL